MIVMRQPVAVEEQVLVLTYKDVRSGRKKSCNR
jgi:hypothetical protein